MVTDGLDPSPPPLAGDEIDSHSDEQPAGGGQQPAVDLLEAAEGLGGGLAGHGEQDAEDQHRAGQNRHRTRRAAARSIPVSPRAAAGCRKTARRRPGRRPAQTEIPNNPEPITPRFAILIPSLPDPPNDGNPGSRPNRIMPTSTSSGPINWPRCFCRKVDSTGAESRPQVMSAPTSV
jgi:hypothetical protein